jgi:hypothetical protein
MSQFDLFGSESAVAAPPLRSLPPAPTYPPAVEVDQAPLQLRVRPELDGWTCTTHRIYLTNLARRLTAVREAGNEHLVFANTSNAREILLKLNGMAGQC